jgi:hypothetical protein
LEGKLNGEGRFYVEGSPEASYSLHGDWDLGVPKLKANDYLLDITMPTAEAEDPKAKKAPPPKGAPVEEEPEGTNELKVTIDVKNPNEEQRKFALSFKIIF